MDKQCLVKFINNRSYWYKGNCEPGDVVFCAGSQAGILGRVIQTSSDIFAIQKIMKKVGHVDPENREDLSDLYRECSEEDQKRILKYLDIKEPYYRNKFIDAVSNHWTEKGLEGMTWDEYLKYIRTVRPIPSAYLPMPQKTDTVSFDGYTWIRIDPLPEIEPVPCGILFNGVVYGTETMIRNVDQEYALMDIREMKYGICRGRIRKGDEQEIMELFPECKTAFFCFQNGAVQAVFSESGYSCITGVHKKILQISHSEYQYICKYRPDEMFREIAPFYSIGAPVVYDGMDAFFQGLDYVIRKDDLYYQMTDLDHWDPPVDLHAKWIWHREGKAAVIDRYIGQEKHVVFPEKIGECPVIGIADRTGGADASYKGIESVTIPSGYQYIGAYAFADCSRLTEAVIPDTVAVIRDGAFLKCKKLRSIVLPKLLTGFCQGYESRDGGCFAFYGCNALKEAYHRCRDFTYDYETTRAFPEKTVLKYTGD